LEITRNIEDNMGDALEDEQTEGIEKCLVDPQEDEEKRIVGTRYCKSKMRGTMF